MQQKHSPLPWKYDERVGCLAIYLEGTDPELSHCIEDADAWAIHFKQGHVFAGSWALEPEDIANAQFIVRAVNSYYDLLEACKLALNEAPWQPLGEDIRTVLRDTITKAQGGVKP